MKVLSPTEEKMELEFVYCSHSLIFCALSTKWPQEQLWKAPQNSVGSRASPARFFLSWNNFLNFYMTKTTVLANKLFTWKSLAGFQSKQKHLPLNGIPNITHFLALPPDHYVLSESDKNNSVTKNPQSNLKIINRQLTPLKFTCSFTWKIILLLFLSQEMLYCCWALLSS